MFLTINTKSEPAPQQILKEARKAYKAAIAEHDKAEADVQRLQAKRDSMNAVLEAYLDTDAQVIADARQKLALALADDGDDAEARDSIRKAEYRTEQARSDLEAVSGVLRERSAVRTEARAAMNQAARQYWKAVSNAELAKLPEEAANILRRAHLADVLSDPYQMTSDFSTWLFGWAGETRQADRKAIVAELEKEYKP